MLKEGLISELHSNDVIASFCVASDRGWLINEGSL